MDVVVKRWLDWWNTGDVAIADELYAPEYHRHGSDGASDAPATRALVGMYRSAFPDLHFAVEDTITEGDRVAVRWWGTGTHRGALRGLEATGRSIAMPGCDILRIQGDRLVESWALYDRMELMSQLQG
jgi:steroid delta-isomerase-like uncharacterized protein